MIGGNQVIGLGEQQTDQPEFVLGIYQCIQPWSRTWLSCNNRLTAEIDYYDRYTKGIILGSQLSNLLTGAFAAPNTNIGSMRNRGVELNLGWKDKIGHVSYGVNVNASYNKTRLESWSQLLTRGATYSNNNVFINMPYNYTYTYVDRGIAQTWADHLQCYAARFTARRSVRLDLNGDGSIDGNDQKALQSARDRPTTSYALNAYASWKGIDIGMLWQGTAGRKDFWLNAFNNVNFGTSRYAVTQDLVNNPWTVENRGGILPSIGGSGNNTAQTTFWLDNMSYLRLKNVQLGYTFPKPLFSKLGVTNFRIAGTAENLLTIDFLPWS